MISVNTKDILFICGGAFSGIDKKIARRVQAHAMGICHPERTGRN